ncbi:hypothetical protein RRG08_045825 [Elysia crispata]|uniref:Uncharacterized protein n=1 Tax=Elysia crispata TaxID=231223 RepID=A0AAE1D6V5_9GAST|nr:hypothetical protein RRG08_045825 [Elysia crispata]
MFYSWPRSTGLLLLVALSFPFGSALNFSESNFRIRRARRVPSGATQIKEITRPGMTLSFCAALCGEEGRMFQYNAASNSCKTYDIQGFYVSPVQLTSDSDWTVGCKEDVWRLVLSSMEGNSMLSVHDIWVSSGTHHDDSFPPGFPRACLRWPYNGS